MIRSRLVVTKDTPLAPRGLVTAEHPLGAEVGAKILMAGGNAVDAAVATAFAMTVVEPFMSTIGGSGTAEMFPLGDGVSTALFAWPRVQGDVNVFGPLSVAVPGSVAGLTEALARWGTMELRDVLAPAIELARDGFVPDWYQALTTAKYVEELSAFPESARTYLRHGRSIHRPATIEYADRVTYPELARSLELIARDGADAFYRGAIADALVAHMRETGGLIAQEDLASYRVHVSAPLTSRYRDLDVMWSPGATGGLTALEVLNILGQFPPDRVAWTTPTGLHHRAQAIRHAFLDRFQHLGDPEVVKDAPWECLASADYARAVAAEIRRNDQPIRRVLSAGPAPRGPRSISWRGRRAPSNMTSAQRTCARWTGSATW